MYINVRQSVREVEALRHRLDALSVATRHAKLGEGRTCAAARPSIEQPRVVT